MNIPPSLRLIYGGSIDLQSYYTNYYEYNRTNLKLKGMLIKYIYLYNRLEFKLYL